MRRNERRRKCFVFIWSVAIWFWVLVGLVHRKCMCCAIFFDGCAILLSFSFSLSFSQSKKLYMINVLGSCVCIRCVIMIVYHVRIKNACHCICDTVLSAYPFEWFKCVCVYSCAHDFLHVLCKNRSSFDSNVINSHNNINTQVKKKKSTNIYDWLLHGNKQTKFAWRKKKKKKMENVFKSNKNKYK